MESCKNFRWNKKFFKPIKDIIISENRNFCVTLSIVKQKDDNGKVINEPILSIKRWRRRRDSEGKLYYRPSRGFNIRNKKQWLSILNALKSYGKIFGGESMDLSGIEEIELDKGMKQLLRSNPEITLKILGEVAVFIGKSKPGKIDFIRKALKLVGSIDAELMSVFNKLSTEKPEALKDLNSMLDDLSLTQINAFAKYIHVRLKALDIFDKLITDEKTYELKGQRESMHHFLEDNSWILGEDYELLTSNKTLKTLIRKAIGKKIKNGKHRPDFALVCQGDMKLVIIEIKKPSYPLKFNDVDQLMLYKAIAEESLGNKFSFQGFLVGGKCSSELESNKEGYKYIRIKTYANIITNTRNRYEVLLKVYERKMSNVDI